MISPPKRSVTRFFIPLIDVLILLFCIFLLMPYVKPDEGESAPANSAAKDPDTAELAKELDRLRREAERLARERETVVRKQMVFVLEIDPISGKLYYRNPERVELASQAEAVAMIDRSLRLAGNREAYFLILYPRDLSGFPEQRQATSYERWFSNVPHGFDNPRGRHAGGMR